MQVMTQFGDIAIFLAENEDVGPSLRPKLLEILQSLAHLKTELAVVIDIGEHFVKSTYTPWREMDHWHSVVMRRY